MWPAGVEDSNASLSYMLIVATVDKGGVTLIPGLRMRLEVRATRPSHYTSARICRQQILHFFLYEASTTTGLLVTCENKPVSSPVLSEVQWYSPECR